MNNNNVATLAGGCFWCIEAVFEQVDGVDIIESGYTGGHTLNPSYEEVCAGITGHAEAVRLSFDVGVITYREILEIFFSIHDHIFDMRKVLTKLPCPKLKVYI